MIGTSIMGYKITRVVGEGGMAIVYEAEQESLKKKVAIKLLKPEFVTNTDVSKRFIKEAKLMATLKHPNITDVINLDEQPSQPSIIMEFLEGEDLSQRIKRSGTLSLEEIKVLFSQVLEAFQYAHQEGIVHRDIKPANIFILANNQVKIVDFGIAKQFGLGLEATNTGMIGTPMYMSPEQVRSDKSLDHRSDIYSLGITLYYAINGHPPYSADSGTEFDIFSKIVHEPLPAFTVESPLNNLVKKACRKNREERYQSCEDWLHALKRVGDIEETIVDPPVRIASLTEKIKVFVTQRKKQLLVGMGAVLLGIVIFVGINKKASTNPPEKIPNFPIDDTKKDLTNKVDSGGVKKDSGQPVVDRGKRDTPPPPPPPPPPPQPEEVAKLVWEGVDDNNQSVKFEKIGKNKWVERVNNTDTYYTESKDKDGNYNLRANSDNGNGFTLTFENNGCYIIYDNNPSGMKKKYTFVRKSKSWQ